MNYPNTLQKFYSTQIIPFMKTYSLLLILSCFVFYSCAVDHIEPMKGNIEGYVRLLDSKIQSSNKSTNNHSGVKVVLEGINPAIEVQTDGDGHWIMRDVPAGTYNVSYSKTGFESFKQFSVRHVGGNVSTFPYLHDQRETSTEYGPLTTYPYFKDKLELSSVELDTVLSLTSLGMDGIWIKYEANTTIEWGMNQGHLLCFLSNNGSVSYDRYRYIQGYHLDNPNGHVSINLHIGDLKRNGFKSGDMVSMKVYTAPRGFLSTDFSYYDPTLGLRIYTGLSEKALETTFKIP
jgi:hypothetical protein